MTPIPCSQCGGPLGNLWRKSDICQTCIDALVHGPRRYTVEELRSKIRAANAAYAEMEREGRNAARRQNRQDHKWQELRIALSQAERRNQQNKEAERARRLAGLDGWSRFCAFFSPPQFDIPDLPEVEQCRKALEEFEAPRRVVPKGSGTTGPSLYEIYEKAKTEAKEAEFLLKYNIPQLQARYYGQLAGMEHLKTEPQKHEEDDAFSSILKYAQEHAAFIRRKKDYARGNQLDNFIRNYRMDMIAQVCGNCCVVCGSSDGLQLDHLWLPKNEGGNFAMLHRPSSCLVSNVLLLCRSCNAGKCDRDPRTYLSRLSIDVRRRIGAAQSRLTREMTGDGDLCLLIETWYKHKVATLEESLEYLRGLRETGRGQGAEASEAESCEDQQTR